MHGKFPGQLKKADVIPVFKKENHNEPIIDRYLTLAHENMSVSAITK